MKKRLIIQSAVLLVLVIVLATVATYAWFVSSQSVSAAMNISVVGMKSVTVSYYRDYEDGAGYISSLPTAALIDNETFYPGKSAYCRLDIYNRSGESATVDVSFLQASISLTPSSGTEHDEAEIDLLNESFTLESVVTPFQNNNMFAPNYTADGNAQKFLSALKPTLNSPDVTGSIALASGINVAANATVSIYYRFHLHDTLSQLSGVFGIRADTVRISVN